jgi:hypothetical protein
MRKKPKAARLTVVVSKALGDRRGIPLPRRLWRGGTRAAIAKHPSPPSPSLRR